MFYQKIVNMNKSGHCRQVFMTFGTGFRWPLVIVDRLLFRGSFSTKIVWAGFRVVIVVRRSLFGGGH